MKNAILISIFAIFLASCSDKKAVIQDPLKNELLAYTQKFEDTNDKFLAVGTYLNPIHQDEFPDKKNEHFIITIYPKDSKINYSSFKVNDDNNGTKISILEDNDPLLKLTTFQMPWGIYLKVSAPQKNSDTLNLSFERFVDSNGTSRPLQVSLNFRKIAKSLYWNSK
ncbi:hypothetical protein Q4Y15_000853 [Campylobacter fetus]|uniref:Lipoprotein n=3 Tax=Campylobacter fetus TaxID=196 RepID=A0AAE6IXA4_CAMFE|nr:hypothetical protein [Campylobacter fetus]OCS31624.1 hypothetical protein CFVLMG6570_03785 [Campylobacter fetus subsp. venerealis LMG 6570 = CCUG 33900]OCS43188.1 hypothetical protein CFVI02298_00945 [Campylobacter fetus subsp. venerealis cfvi02/298]AHE93462.1 putative lipoprotein [Campylobacter fetus subsp. venerealis cfvi03/293]AIR78070.1 putative lipoprotein [Campylobacter fetus subsp. fetus 04/554]AIR79785.1 hypothetical lipoprotein [Campylobacter fetus subsp. venerealis 97/608]